MESENITELIILPDLSPSATLPNMSENAIAWIEYFYNPPELANGEWIAFGVMLLIGVVFCSFGISKWIKKRKLKKGINDARD